MKKEKGSVTIFVLITGIFFIAVLLLVNMGLINKNANQEKEIAQITKNYTITDEDFEFAYNNATSQKEDRYLKASEIVDMIYPVGSIYISTTSANPSILLGGTWENYGEGRTLIGIGDNGETNYTEVEKEGGKENQSITLGVANLPSHTHSIPALSGSTSAVGNHTHSIPSLSGYTSTNGNHSHIFGYRSSYAVTGNSNAAIGYGYSSSQGNYYTSTTGDHSHTITTYASTTGEAGGHSHTFSTTATNTGSTGSGSAFTVNDVQPYITVYMWKRTA